MSLRRGALHRVRVVATEEYRRALETRWLFGFTALFTALVLGLSYFGLAWFRSPARRTYRCPPSAFFDRQSSLALVLRSTVCSPATSRHAGFRDQ